MAVRFGGAAQEIAEDRLRFDRLSAFDIAQHRRCEGQTLRLKRRPDPVQERPAWGKALRRRNRGAFIEKSRAEIRGANRDDVADRSAHQAGDARESGDENPFLPYVLPDRVAEPRIET